MPLQRKKVFTTGNGTLFDLVKSESSNAFEAKAKDKRLHSSRKEFWIGLAKEPHSPIDKYQQSKFHSKKKTSLSLVQSYKNQRLNEILYTFMYPTGFAAKNSNKPFLTCQSAASDVDKVNAVRPGHAPPLLFAPHQLEMKISQAWLL